MGDKESVEEERPPVYADLVDPTTDSPASPSAADGVIVLAPPSESPPRAEAEVEAVAADAELIDAVIVPATVVQASDEAEAPGELVEMAASGELTGAGVCRLPVRFSIPLFFTYLLVETMEMDAQERCSTNSTTGVHDLHSHTGYSAVHSERELTPLASDAL